jgi:hypothetical protein
MCAATAAPRTQSPSHPPARPRAGQHFVCTVLGAVCSALCFYGGRALWWPPRSDGTRAARHGARRRQRRRRAASGLPVDPSVRSRHALRSALAAALRLRDALPCQRDAARFADEYPHLERVFPFLSSLAVSGVTQLLAAALPGTFCYLPSCFGAVVSRRSCCHPSFLSFRSCVLARALRRSACCPGCPSRRL